MARTWALPEQVSTAILLHHDYVVWKILQPMNRCVVFALTALAEYAIHKYEGQENSSEWYKASEQVRQF